MALIFLTNEENFTKLSEHDSSSELLFATNYEMLVDEVSTSEIEDQFIIFDADLKNDCEDQTYKKSQELLRLKNKSYASLSIAEVFKILNSISL